MKKYEVKSKAERDKWGRKAYELGDQFVSDQTGYAVGTVGGWRRAAGYPKQRSVTSASTFAADLGTAANTVDVAVGVDTVAVPDTVDKRKLPNLEKSLGHVMSKEDVFHENASYLDNSPNTEVKVSEWLESIHGKRRGQHRWNNVEDIMGAAVWAEHYFEQAGWNKSDWHDGMVVEVVSGEKVASSYKYGRNGSRALLVWHKNQWILSNLEFKNLFPKDPPNPKVVGRVDLTPPATPGEDPSLEDLCSYLELHLPEDYDVMDPIWNPSNPKRDDIACEINVYSDVQPGRPSVWPGATGLLSVSVQLLDDESWRVTDNGDIFVYLESMEPSDDEGWWKPRVQLLEEICASYGVDIVEHNPRYIEEWEITCANKTDLPTAIKNLMTAMEDSCRDVLP